MHGKLKLDLDELAVESFDTSQTEKRDGTVFGEQCTCWTNCTCPGCPSCDNTCGGTCGNTCVESCHGSCDWNCDTELGYTCKGDGSCGWAYCH